MIKEDQDRALFGQQDFIEVKLWPKWLDEIARCEREFVSRKVQSSCMIVGEILKLQSNHSEIGSELSRNAIAKRRLEFVAGRNAAYLALGEIGFHQRGVERLADGSPGWPEGVVGSISHSDCMVACIVGSKSVYGSLGIDLEESAPLPTEIYDLILSKNEVDRVIPTWKGKSDAGMVMFSCKEAIFKSDWPIFGERIDFKDIELYVVHQYLLVGRVRRGPEDGFRSYRVQVTESDCCILTVSSPMF
jgi:4'-phosphopantetheinyl transferase EntD